MRRLHTRIYLHFLAVLLVVGALSSLVFATGWRVEMLRAWTLRLARHAAALIAGQPDAGSRERMVQHLGEQLELDVTVRAPDGRLLWSSGRAMPPLDADDAAAARKDALLVQKRRGWFVAAPVRDTRNGELIGILETFPVRRFPPGGILRPLGGVALLLLIVGLATGPLARRMSRPVERLTEASKRLGAGNLSYRIPRGRKPRRPDELDQLIVAWNEMAARVERLVAGQRELLANVSHELRSPLARVRVALELLPQDEARVKDLSTDIDELERLVDDVLTTARLDAAALPLRRELIDADDLMQKLAERARHDPVTSAFEVRVDANAGSVEVDGALLRRAIWNLVENAAKYGAPPITLQARREGSRILLGVTDEGLGIAPEDRERVLDPFYRVDRARTPHAARGFGLGLTFARRVAEVHGGHISVTNGNHDRGCRILLDLPAAPLL